MVREQYFKGVYVAIMAFINNYLSMPPSAVCGPARAAPQTEETTKPKSLVSTSAVLYSRSPFLLCTGVIYFPYPKYALRDHLSP